MRNALVCLLLTLAFTAHAETITGRVVGVADGDTITVLDANKVQHKIRPARSTKDLLEISEEVSKKKVALVSVTEKIDTPPMSEMMFTLMAGMAQLERRMIAERTVTALQHKKATGQQYTNQTPYGFEAIEDRLVQVLAETKVVALDLWFENLALLLAGKKLKRRIDPRLGY